MSEHKYSVAEIDALRSAVWQKIACSQGSYSYFQDMNGNPTPEQRSKDAALSARVEDQLRTYMLAGVVADDFNPRVAG